MCLLDLFMSYWNIRFSNFSTDKKVQDTLWDLCGVMAFVRKDTSMVKSPRLNTREPPAIPPKCVIFVGKLRNLGPTPQELWDTPIFSWKNPMFIYTAWLMGHVLGHEKFFPWEAENRSMVRSLKMMLGGFKGWKQLMILGWWSDFR